VKQYHLERDADKGTVWGEPDGDELSVKVTQADGTVTEETSRGFLMSGDKNFRPSDVVFAPDGSLYMSDWQNVIIGHMQHNVRDPNRDHAQRPHLPHHRHGPRVAEARRHCGAADQGPSRET